MSNITASKKIHSLNDAKNLAKKRMPKLMFDFVDGASGDEKLCEINSAALDQIRLEPKVLRNVENRNLKKKFLGIRFDQPFGFSPMGMCNLTWSGADKILAKESITNNIPICVSMASSTSLEKMYELSEGRSWIQLYNFQERFVMELLQRAEQTGYKVAILTVDVPIQFRRAKDNKNGFTVPFKIGPKQMFDFATHPLWSLTTLLGGIPKPMNYETSMSGNKFIRSESRGATDWETLKRVRNAWKGKLIIKGVMSPEDALKIKAEGVDAIQVSNHGGRQLDSATAAIEALPLIRNALGKEFPLLFDSGVRSGSDIIRALALGANYVMLGRPLMYGIGADGEKGLRRILDIIKDELSTALGLVGLIDINDVTAEIIAKKFIQNNKIDFRYIELMQTGDNLEYFKKYHISSEIFKDYLRNNKWIYQTFGKDAGPSLNYIRPEYKGKFGIIAPYSKDFCKTCNRLRITSKGDLRLCLFGNTGISVRHLLQRDDQLNELKDLILKQMQFKKESHYLELGETGSTKNLSKTGG